METRLTTARLTHVALPVHDVDATIEWYQRFTPLQLLARREDSVGQSAWIGMPDMVERPFIVVLVSLNADKHKGAQPMLAPFAHLGVEVPERGDVDAIAARGRDEGCLVWEPQDLPPPVGYVCALHDPDGNMVEFSHDQGVYATVAAVWGEQPHT